MLEVEIAGVGQPVFEIQLEMHNPAESGPLQFLLQSGENEAVYEIAFRDDEVLFVPLASKAYLQYSRRGPVPIEEIFGRDPPIIRFADGSWMEGNRLFPAPTGFGDAFRRERIATWNWEGVNIRRESQGKLKHNDSIQYRVIERLKSSELGIDYDLIIDDDGSNEVADVVALKLLSGNKLLVHLFHCKFSLENEPGARIDDLYTVCGQAQKCVVWRESLTRMLEMLIKREDRRASRIGVSGIEKGDSKSLRQLFRRAHLLIPEFAVWVVQPALSRAAASVNQLHLLAVTELYLKETFAIPFGVIASD
jgi:hypothetical protein